MCVCVLTCVCVCLCVCVCACVCGCLCVAHRMSVHKKERVWSWCLCVCLCTCCMLVNDNESHFSAVMRRSLDLMSFDIVSPWWKNLLFPVADLGSPRERGANYKAGTLTYYFGQFSPKTPRENERRLIQRECTPPPLGFANDFQGKAVNTNIANFCVFWGWLENKK